MLRGDTGQVVWRQESLIGQEATMPYGGGLPAVADVNSDGLDEMVHEFATLYGVLSGKTGTPVYPPAFLCGPKYLGKWFAYSSPTLADLDGDGKIEVYLNSLSNACGGFGALRIEGKPLWVQFRDNLHGPVGFAPVGDFDGDGKLEIAVPAVDGTLLCLKAATGGLKWQVRAAVWGDVVAADINGDGVQELLFHGLDNRLHAVSGRDGHEIWSVAAPGRPIVADVDGDGLLEVLAVGLDGVLRIVGQGKIKP
jgi:outer membrane protein assembly factor BamB